MAALASVGGLAAPEFEAAFIEFDADEVARAHSICACDPGAGGAQLWHEPAAAKQAHIVTHLLAPPSVEGAQQVGAFDLGGVRPYEHGAGPFGHRVAVVLEALNGVAHLARNIELAARQEL